VNGGGAPAISMPVGGGAIRGMGEQLTTNPANGTCTLTVPIAVSPGRSGFQPRLVLAYDSSAGSGPFGFGWRLSVPAITRRTDRGLPRYDDAADSDTFLLTDADELVPAPGEVERDGYRVRRYRPRVEGQFARVERWTRLADGDVHWRTISRDNVLTVYGWDATSRIADPAEPPHVWSWLACHVYDDKGNALLYDYAAEDAANVDLSAASEQRRVRGANRYLKRIHYGNRTPLLLDPTLPSFRRPHAPLPDFTAANWMFEVVFDYGEGHYQEQPPDGQGRVFAKASPNASGTWPVRQDSFSTCRPAFEVRTHRLCRRVLVFHRFPAELGTATCLVRATGLMYREKPIGSFLTAIQESGFRHQPDDSYLRRSLPPIELGYTESPLEAADPVFQVHDVDEVSLENLPPAPDGRHRWVDLDGEGIVGMLSEEGEGWFYKPNLGEGRLGPMEPVAARPALATTEHRALLDLAGDGRQDLVVLGAPAPGFHGRAEDGAFEPFRAFASFPNLAWGSEDVRLADVAGAGLADVLVTGDECIEWHPSLGEDGFGPATRLPLPQDELHGPRVVFADALRTVFLADLNGDGLPDLVRVRSGEVGYWPNLGYGRFGPMVAMDGAPWLDPPDLFEPRRVLLADTDGSGTADLIYVGRDGIRVYLNQAGNGWSEARVLRAVPAADGVTSVSVVDLIGRGTACVVWSTALPGHERRPVRYADLMNGVKPHLLVDVRNNLGTETRITYGTSTQAYLADKAAGTPWLTRLPFPVHVVTGVETLDTVGRNRHVTGYTYHHGCFDAVEREFRGFGRVDELDTDELAAVASESYVPPVLTKRWYHTGVRLASGLVSRQFESEYTQEAGLTPAQLAAQRPPDTVLPAGLTADETREAVRALRGLSLRREVYALDGGPAQALPYAVEETSYTVQCLQPRGAGRHGVFLATPLEAVELQYERRQPADPRVVHRLTLDVDEFGDVLVSASVAYGRRAGAPADPLLTAPDVAVQQAIPAVFTVRDVTNTVSLDDAYRTPLPAEERVFELMNAAPAAPVAGATTLFRAAELRALIAAAGDGAHDIPYEDFEGAGVVGAAPYRRLIEDVRTIYRANDLGTALPLLTLEALALPAATHRLALTPSLATRLYVASGKLAAADLDAVLTGPGGYVHSEGDGGWWVPSTALSYAPDAGATPAQELNQAAAHFFLPRRYVDPFGAATAVTYDGHDLLLQEVRDPLDNRVTAGVRDVNGALVQVGNDYRVLQPALIMDANRNRRADAYDALGRVVGTAVMGKPEETLGDSLDGFDPDLTDAAIVAHLADPVTGAAALLQRATTRVVANPFASPPVVATMARETHDADLGAGESPKIQHRFSYSDGLGREIQRKDQAPGGQWVATGWTVYDNKGNPVRKYEPFFDDTPAFRFASATGVSPICFYDPLGRVVATARPDHGWEKVVLAPWRGESWDVNDTVLLDPRTDADAGEYFSRLADAAYLPTWYVQRSGGGLGADEQQAAAQTAVHAGTPSVSFADALGRTFLTVAHNRRQYSGEAPAEELLRSVTVLDIEGNERRLVDAAGRVCARFDHDLLGGRAHVTSTDTGERWVLYDARGNVLRAWDSRGHAFTLTYDALRRPLTRSVRGSDAVQSDPDTLGKDVVYERFEYGEGAPGDMADNVRTRLLSCRDGTGITTTDRYDFKGNCLRTTQQLMRDYASLPDWSQAPALDAESFVNATGFDALDRVRTLTTPDGSVARYGYDERNRLDTVAVNLRGAAAATSFVQHVEYDAQGQRTRIVYGNGTSTVCEYDAATFRLTHQTTTRPGGGNGVAGQLLTSPTTLQDLRYVYDPVGSVVRTGDAALRTVFYNGAQVLPVFAQNYDALYRLIEASGREHTAQSALSFGPDGGYRDYPLAGATQLADLQALRSYAERCEYDGAGNLTKLVHKAAGGSWTRTYAYTGNRLASSTVQPDGSAPVAEPYAHDAHGCMTQMPHLPLMRWSFRELLSAASRQVVNPAPPPDRLPETVRFAYSASGLRTRKVRQRQDGTRRSERIYLLNAEVYREYAADGVTVQRERQTLHVMDDRRRLALVETSTVEGGAAVANPVPAQRYQLANHLDSACLELDETGAVITYEEFTPFGSSALQGGRSAAEVGLKRYRFTAKERDEETGLAYHGARYYAPWLGRWVSGDPEGLARRRSQRGDAPLTGRAAAEARERARRDLPGWNLYTYARDNPLVYVDPTGRIDVATVFLALLPTIGLTVGAITIGVAERAGGREPQQDREGRGRWVQGGESRLFDWWTFGHYLLPATISLVTTLLLDKFTKLKSEEIYAIAGLGTMTLAFLYETIERPLFRGLHRATGTETWRKVEAGLRQVPIIGPWIPDVHKATAGGALEYRSNTIGDVVIGSIGGFTASYLALAALGRAPRAGFAVGIGTLGVATGFGATTLLVYSNDIPTRANSHYDNTRDQFVPGPEPVLNDRLDHRYTPLAPSYA
jgi:RHS repeat-associated protein